MDKKELAPNEVCEALQNWYKNQVKNFLHEYSYSGGCQRTVYKKSYSLNSPDIVHCVYCRKELDELFMGGYPICRDCVEKHETAREIVGL